MSQWRSPCWRRGPNQILSEVWRGRWVREEQIHGDVHSYSRGVRAGVHLKGYFGDDFAPVDAIGGAHYVAVCKKVYQVKDHTMPA